MLLTEYVSRYALARDVTEDYVEQLDISRRKLESFAGQSLDLCDLQDDLVNRWLVNLKEVAAPQTVRNKRRCILTLWRAAADDGLCSAPGRIRPVKIGDVVIDGWNAEEAAKLLVTAQAMTGNQRKVKIPKRLFWSSFVLVAWDTGLRLGDLLDLERRDIWPAEGGAGFISWVQNKTSRSVQLALRQATMQTIEESMAAGSPRAKLWPLGGHREAWYRQFNRLVAKAGLVGTSKYIRRGSSSEVERIQPGAGAAHLGHRTAGLFERHYKVDRIVRREVVLPPPIA